MSCWFFNDLAKYCDGPISRKDSNPQLETRSIWLESEMACLQVKMISC